MDSTALINTTQPLTAAMLEEMETRWPYYVWPSLMALEQGDCTPEEAQRLRSRIALAAGDRSALARVLDPDADFADFYPDMKPVQLSTNATIDAFLDRFGSDSDKETDLLTRMIFDPASRADAPLESEGEQKQTETATDATASRIDAFLAATLQQQSEHSEKSDTSMAGVSAETEGEAETAATPGASGSLSLSLARMMISNGNYAKALDILRRVDLENTQKSIIFADQIRFLKKLIFIQNHRNQ